MSKSRSLAYALGTALLAASAPAAAQPKPPPKAPAIAQTCVACHGLKGVSTTKDTPSLAGQPDIFPQSQLVFMRDGQRQPGVMAGIVKTLTDQNIRDLGAYYAALPPPPAFAKADRVDPHKATAIRGPPPARLRHGRWGRPPQGKRNHGPPPLRQLSQGGFFRPGRDRAAGRPAAR